MPYLLNEEGVIVEDLDGVSWTDVIKQQRARAANEARVASMYAELDEVTEEYVEVVQEVKPSSELVKIEIGKENVALTASLLERMDAMSQRESLTTEAIVAALHAIGTHNPIVNVEAPNVSVEPAAITIEQPDVTVHPPEVRVEAPNVTVHPEIVVDSTAGKRTVTFVRDFSGRVEGAEITEE